MCTKYGRFIFTIFTFFLISEVFCRRDFDGMSKSLSFAKLLRGRFWAPSLYPEIPCRDGEIQTVTLAAGRSWRFFTPEFPNSASAGSVDCMWRFRIPSTADIGDITLTCDHFDISGNFFAGCEEGDFLQIIDDSNEEEETREKLCGDLSRWIPISATFPDTLGKTFNKKYVRNVIATFRTNQDSYGTGFSCRIVGEKRKTPIGSTTTQKTTTTLPTTTTAPPLVCPNPDPDMCTCGRVKSYAFELPSGNKNKLSNDHSSTVSSPQRIVGGTETRPHQYPWQIGLLYRNFMYCGGSLLTKKHILTAAHCTDVLFSINYNKTDFGILFGEHDITTTKDCSFKITVKKIFQHPLYGNKTDYDYDFSVLELEEPVDCSDHVSPVCLPDDKATEATYDNVHAVVTGWGRLDQETGAKPDRLQHVFLQTMSNNECRKTEYGDNEISDSMICAGEKGKDACQGDSGGPMATMEKGQYHLIGVTSWGVGCGKEGYPGVFSRVTSVLPWIKKILGPDLPTNSSN